MRENSLKRRLVTGAVAGTIALSLGMTAFASDQGQMKAESKSGVMSDSRTEGPDRGARRGGEKIVMEKLVESGEISQETADAVEEYIKAKVESRSSEANQMPERRVNDGEKRPDIISELLENGIITDEEAETIKSAIEEEKAEHENAKYEKLAESGLFSDEDIANIKSYMEEKRAGREADMEQLKDMSEEERKAYLEENKGERPKLEDELVEQGIVTEEQAESLKELMRPKKGHRAPREKEEEPVESDSADSGVEADSI